MLLQNGDTALIVAAIEGDEQLNTLKYLIKTGADVNARDRVSYLLELLYYIVLYM